MSEPVRNITDKSGGINSVYPCTGYLTFGPWIYMVPQYHPESVLMLGYAGGTTAGLIKLFYGDVPITAVDLEFVEDPYGVEFILGDAEKVVKDLKSQGRFFDCIIVDLFQEEVNHPPGFVFSEDFVSTITSMCNYLILDSHCEDDLSVYGGLHEVKSITLNKNTFHYFMVNRVARLPIR